MQRNDIDQEPEEEVTNGETAEDDDAEHPAPGIEHYPEPDAENIMPAEDRPGTL
ncbi:MAG: hypothetical protein IPM25_16010 [Chloracidobacterium sp.]|nr:hypothetical protein [Chloracidobacterium sp.]